MKIQISKLDWKNCGPPPPIFYSNNRTIGKTLTDKSYYLKVDIKNQPGEMDSKTVALYVTQFHMGVPEALLSL